MPDEVNLEEMSLKELRALRKRVTRAIDSFKDREKQKAIARLEAQARDMGYSLGELTGTSKSGRSVNPPKYRNPDNPAMTWTGRGRQPDWMKEKLAKGHKKDEFLIA